MEHSPGQRIVVIGGGPGGYEAALVAAQLGSYVTVVDRDGLGGSAVLTDCVPSKTLIATSDLMTEVAGSAELGVRLTDHEGDAATTVAVDLGLVNRRVKQLAADQSADIASRLEKEGVEVVSRARRARRRRPGAGDDRRQGADPAGRRRSWSPPVPRRARCPARSPTASGSSPGSRSTTSTRCPAT